MNYQIVPSDIDAVADDDADASVSLVPSDFSCSEDEQDMEVAEPIDCDDMIVPDDMDLFIRLPEITQNRISDWAGVLRAELVVHDTQHYIIIDDDFDNNGDDFVNILIDDPNPFLIDLTGLNESDEDGDAL